MTPWVRWLRWALLAGVPAAISVQGCEQEGGFECGRQVPGSSSVRRCDGANEVCVCATNSCAKRVGILPDVRGGGAGEPAVSVEGGDESDNWGDCLGPGETGYRYIEAPFARDGLAGECVTAVDLRLGPIAKADEPACPGQVLPTAPSGGTSSGGTSSAGGMSGASGDGGTSGAGGKGGKGGGGGSSGEAGASGSGGASGEAGASGSGGTGAGGAAGMSQGGTGASEGGQNMAGQTSESTSGGAQ